MGLATAFSRVTTTNHSTTTKEVVLVVATATVCISVFGLHWPLGREAASIDLAQFDFGIIQHLLHFLFWFQKKSNQLAPINGALWEMQHLLAKWHIQPKLTLTIPILLTNRNTTAIKVPIKCQLITSHRFDDVWIDIWWIWVSKLWFVTLFAVGVLEWRRKRLNTKRADSSR